MSRSEREAAWELARVEETRMELLLASLNEDEPRMEDISTEEEIRQMRMRGERLVNIYKAIDN